MVVFQEGVTPISAGESSLQQKKLSEIPRLYRAGPETKLDVGIEVKVVRVCYDLRIGKKAASNRSL